MASITYNFVNPEAFDAFIPEVVAQRREKNARVVLLILFSAFICLGGYYLYLNNKTKRDPQDE